jgi:hypothetical protein
MRGPQLTPLQMADLSSLAYSLGAVGSKTRKKFAELVKEVDPARYERSFGDVKLDARFDEHDKKRTETEHQTAIKAAQEKQAADRASLAERYSEDHIKGIESEMTRLGISDYSAGAVLYAHNNPESDPTLRPPKRQERAGSTWEFPSITSANGKEMPFDDFVKDTRKHSNDTAYSMIDSFKNNALAPAFRR